MSTGKWRTKPWFLACSLCMPMLITCLWSCKEVLEAQPADTLAGKETPSKPASAIQVQTVAAKRSDLSLRSEATGYLEARRRVEITAETAGRIVAREVEEGEQVSSNQLLVQIDSRESWLEYREAEAERLKIRAQYAIRYEQGTKEDQGARPASSGRSVEEAESLFAQGLISQQELNASKLGGGEAAGLLAGYRQEDVRAATSGLLQAEQRLERARLALERTEIAAPFSGRVADLEIELGQHVVAGESLLTLLEDDRLVVQVDVLESDLVRLRPGAPARVRVPALGDLLHEGSVHTINPLVDSKTGTGRVTVALPNQLGQLMAGLFAYVSLEVGLLPNRLIVPDTAVLERQGRQLVFRVEDGRALWTYVETGVSSQGWVEILQGLEEDDLVAVKGNFALAHEAVVESVQ